MRERCPICNYTIINNILAIGDWHIQSCSKCTNAWTHPFPEGVEYEMEDFHGNFKYRGVEDLPTQWRKAVLTQADLISEYVASDGSIFEVGCGEGIFLKELKRRGFRIAGIDPSKAASKRAREAGLMVTTGSFPDIQIMDQFDAVVVNHVVEHMREPVTFLKKLGSKAFHGRMFLMQSHWKGLVPLIQREAWHAWAPEYHYWHFTPKGLQYIFRILNWDILKIKYSSLHHGNSLLSKIGELLPGQGDQFHMVIKIG